MRSALYVFEFVSYECRIKQRWRQTELEIVTVRVTALIHFSECMSGTPECMCVAVCAVNDESPSETDSAVSTWFSRGSPRHCVPS